MNLVRFDKPRLREVGIFHFRCEITWEYHGHLYKSVGEDRTAMLAYTCAWAPIVSEGWLRHVPHKWVPRTLYRDWERQQSRGIRL